MKVETLPSGSKRVRVYVPAEKKYKSFTAKTGREAKDKANEYLATHRRPAGEAITVAEALERYCEAKSAVLSPSTIRNYKHAAKRYFTCIADYPIKNISKEVAQRLVNELSENHAPKTVYNIYGLFSAAYAMFCDDVLQVSMPPKKKFQPYVLTDTDVKHLLDATEGTDLGMAIRLAIFIPARRSEICALDPATDVIDERFININKDLVLDNYGQWVLNTTKTYESSRIVEMPQKLLKSFTHKIAMTPNQLTERFIKKASELGIDCRFHDLRHYGATFLHAQGVPDKYIMQRGGWSSVATLQKIYTHTLPEVTDEATNKVSEKYAALIG